MSAQHWPIRVPAGWVWFIGGYRRWMPLIVIWLVRTEWSIAWRRRPQ